MLCSQALAMPVNGRNEPGMVSTRKTITRDDAAGDPPIFVVGAPRSGTTLLAAMLAAHSGLSCGYETRFFRFLARADVARLCGPESWPDSAVAFLFSIRLRDRLVADLYGVDEEQVRRCLQHQVPSVSAMLSSLTEPLMRREGKRRWVEKSPEHLQLVRDIRKYFPLSPIVRIIRDPRDAAISVTKTHFGPSDFLAALMLWRRYDERSARFFEEDGYCYTLRYEDLIERTEGELKRLCVFLGEKYEDRMLDTSSSADSVIAEHERHKQLARRPPDPSRTGVWKRELSGEQNRVAEALVGDRLVAYRYEVLGKLERTARVYPSIDMLLEYPRSLTTLVDEGIQFRPARGDRNSGDHLVYLGEPDRDHWLRYQIPARWWDAVCIVARIVEGKLAGRRIYWLRHTRTGAERGYCARAIVFWLRLTASRQFVQDAESE